MFHACWRLILKDLWAEIFFAATLIVKTEQVTIRVWKDEDIKHRAAAAAVSKYETMAVRIDKGKGWFFGEQIIFAVLYVLLLSSL